MYRTTLYFSIALLLVSVSTARAAEPVLIVTLGDSITKGYREGVKPEETFSAYLEAGLKRKGIEATVTNVGIGGERTDQALLRLEKDVIAKKPKFVTIMYGTNDSYVDIGAKKSRLTVEEYRKNLQSLVTKLREVKIEPILMTPPCWGDKAGVDGSGEHPNKKLEPFANACRDVANEMKTPLVDHYLAWRKRRGRGVDISTWMTDECHPNAEGHKYMADFMLPVVERVITAK